MEELTNSETPEALYRKRIFDTEVDELPKILDDLSETIIPDCNNGFVQLLTSGLTLFNVTDNEDLNYEVFQKHYYKSLHKVVVLHHKFVEEGLLIGVEDQNVKNLIKFNRLFEIFYYWEQGIRSLWRVKKASNPLYDSSLNTDIGLFRFKPIDPDGNNCYQNLILYLLALLAERGWRRQVDQCMERIYTKDGFDTHSWKPIMDIQTFVYSMTQKDVNYQQWFNLTSNPSNPKNIIKYLTETTDLHFIDIDKDRKLFSFINGIYETAVWDEEAQRYTDRWYPHVESSESTWTSADICPKRSACKYFDKKFNNYDDIEDWYDIPTPNFQNILDFQQFPEDVCRWMYILLCGRLLHEVGSLDEWQVMPFLKGVGSSGKSTILTRVSKEFFHPLDVGVLSNNCEKKFGLAALKDKFLFIAPEIKGNLGLEQCDFQTIISGEDTSVAEKFKTASSSRWTVPGAMAGNEAPGYTDNQGSIARRMVVFNFSKKVTKGDTQLGRKLLNEIPLLIKKGNMAYLEAINKHGKDGIWNNVLPKYFKNTQRDMAEQTNSLINFLGSDKVKFGDKYYCKQKTFIQAYNEHVRENSLAKCTWKRDFYESVFEEHNIEICGRDIKIDGKKPTCIYLKGVDVVTEGNASE